MAHQKYRGQTGHVDMAGLSILVRETGERDSGRFTVQGPARGAGAQSTLELRVRVGRMRAPLRIVALLQQPPAIDRHQLRQLRMHARTMQALVVVFPEYFPIALDGLEQDVADDQLSQGPRVEPVQRQIEYLFERRRTIGQGNEDETIPFPDADLVEGKIGHVEAAGVSLGRRAQQVPLQVVSPGVVRTDDAAGAQYSLGLAAQSRAAMPTGVVKPLQGTLIVAHQEHPLVAQFKGTERARPRHVAGPAGIHPVAVPNAPQFPFVLTRVVVGIRRQAFGVLGKAVVAQVDRGRSQHRLPLVTTKNLYLSVGYAI